MQHNGGVDKTMQSHVLIVPKSEACIRQVCDGKGFTMTAVLDWEKYGSRRPHD